MKCLILLLLFAGAFASIEKNITTLGTTKANPATSCAEIYELNPTSRGTVGQYYIKTCNGPQKVTCNMKLKCGGIEGGWMQVVDVDMNRDESCPGTWQNIFTPKRLCQGNGVGCSSALFYMNEITYEHICGQAKGYQKGSTDAFVSNSPSVNSAYVDGISITIGSPRNHVWTYAVGPSDNHNYGRHNCPCATHPGTSPPAFVGNDYYCESGNVGAYDVNLYYLSDPLWDGDGCTISDGCCAQIGMPWFYKKLPMPVNDNFEVRICKDENDVNENVVIEKLELFVHS